MSEAPKRIWAVDGTDGYLWDYIGVSGPPEDEEHAVAYVRADIAADMLAALESVIEDGFESYSASTDGEVVVIDESVISVVRRAIAKAGPVVA